MEIPYPFKMIIIFHQHHPTCSLSFDTFVIELGNGLMLILIALGMEEGNEVPLRYLLEYNTLEAHFHIYHYDDIH